MTTRHIAAIAGLVCAYWTGAFAQQVPAVHELGIKYMRDSEEYATLARQVYRLAGESAARAASSAPSRRWAVVLDVDETALDNSTYQLERAAYSLPFDAIQRLGWNGVKRAPCPVPSTSSRRCASGGHVGWITKSRHNPRRCDSGESQIAGLWNDDDRLCLQKTPQHTKADRRKEIVTRTVTAPGRRSRCRWLRSWAISSATFPRRSEQIPQTGTDSAFGRVCSTSFPAAASLRRTGWCSDTFAPRREASARSADRKTAAC